MTNNNKVSTAQAKINAAGIRQLWQTGRASWQRVERRRAAYRYGTKRDILRAEAARHGLNIDTMMQCWRLAQQYGKADIDTIHAAVIKHCSRFGVTNMLAVLRIADRTERDKVMRRAVRESWPSALLEQQIQGLYGTRRRAAAGRKPHVPDDPIAQLVALDASAATWIRWCRTALPQLPPSLRPRIERATRAARTVQRAVAARLQRRRAK